MATDQQSNPTARIVSIALTGILVVTLVCILGWRAFDGYERSAAVYSIAKCMHLDASQKGNRDFVDYKIDEMSNGQGWRTGELVVRVQYGCLSGS
jgi:purine-cytosine permease-like protein